MRKHKVNKKDFEKIFKNRRLTLRERYMQSFWLVDCGDYYELHQKISLLCLLISPLFYLLVTVPVFILKGYFGVVDMYRHFIPYALGEPLRVDLCSGDSRSTAKLLALTDWI